MSKKHRRQFEYEEVEVTEIKEVTETVEVHVEHKHPKIHLTFDDWFTRVATERRFNHRLREPLRIHFEKHGFMETRRFDEGLKHFGF